MPIMTNVYWLEQTETDVPATNDWLSADEVLRLNNLRFAKRRADWRLGRWSAKRALALSLNLAGDRQSLARIEIRAASSGAPEAFINNQPATSTISLSHSFGRAICAVAAAETALGCDLERIESHSNAFVTDYFTGEEQALMARSPSAHRPLLLSLLWSAKESALKALHAGLRLDTRSLTVSAEDVNSGDPGWHALEVRRDDLTFHGWWQQSDNFIKTVVADPPSNTPMQIQTWQ